MIAEQFEPRGIECLIRTAVDLWRVAGTATCADLSERQKEVLNRALIAVEDDHAGSPPTAPPRSVVEPVGERAPVWILNTWDKNNDVYTLHISEESARASLAEYVRTRWDHDALHGDESPIPPQDDRRAIALFYGPQEECEETGYRIYQEEVHA